MPGSHVPHGVHPDATRNQQRTPPANLHANLDHFDNLTKEHPIAQAGFSENIQQRPERSLSKPFNFSQVWHVKEEAFYCLITDQIFPIICAVAAKL